MHFPPIYICIHAGKHIYRQYPKSVLRSQYDEKYPQGYILRSRDIFLPQIIARNFDTKEIITSCLSLLLPPYFLSELICQILFMTAMLKEHSPDWTSRHFTL